MVPLTGGRVTSLVQPRPKVLIRRRMNVFLAGRIHYQMVRAVENEVAGSQIPATCSQPRVEATTGQWHDVVNGIYGAH